MDKKQAVTVGLTAAITLAVSLGGTWLVNSIGAGQSAADEAQIEEVVQGMLITPSGETYGAVLIRIDKEVVGIKAAVDILVDE